jgi:hypothetical protein
MATIVEYTDRKAPRNSYPLHIISPSRSGVCCFLDMEELGAAEQEGRWMVQYKRCRRCGFTVHLALREIVDTGLATELRQILATSFQRNSPNY